MNLNQVELSEKLFSVGDEIVVYDEITYVGATVLSEENLRNRVAFIPASAKDDSGMLGFTKGNTYSLRIWDTQQNFESKIEAEHISGPELFTKHESVILSLEKTALTDIDDFEKNRVAEVNCYPNPFNEEITIELNLMKESAIEITVMNQLGQQVKRLLTGNQMNAGIHRISWDGAGTDAKVPAGMYYLKIKIDDQNLIKKVVYNKR